MYRLKLILTLFLVGSLVFCESAEAQEKPLNAAQIQDSLRTLIRQLDTVVHENIQKPPLDFSKDNLSLARLFSMPPVVETATEAGDAGNEDPRLEIIGLKQKVLSRDYGLELGAGYLENIDAGIFTDGDIFYNRRARLELNWNLLKNGFFGSRHKAKILEAQKGRIRKEIENDRELDKREHLYNLIIYYFDKQRISVIENYTGAIDKQLRIVTKLYNMDYVHWNEVLGLMTAKARLENKLKAYKTYDQQFDGTNVPALDASDFPLVKVQLQKLLQNPSLASTDSRIDSLGSPVSYNFLTDDVRLSLFARYNLYSDSPEIVQLGTVAGREYFSVGLNVSIPIPFNTRAKKALFKAKHSTSQQNSTKKTHTRKEEIYNLYYEYEFTFQQYIHFFGKYLENEEKIRQQDVQSSLNNSAYSPKTLSHLLLLRYQSAVAIIDLKQKLYLNLLKLGRYTSMPISEFTLPVDVRTYFPPMDKLTSDNEKLLAHRVYIWSSAFEKSENDKLLEFLKKYGLKRVYLSLGPGGTLSGKTADFIAKAHTLGLKVELLIGNNHLIRYKAHASDIRNAVSLAKLVFDGLHLDVEPQVFDDYDSRKSYYKELYVQMLVETAKLAREKKVSLGVSIPHYFDSILQAINQLTDEETVMVYETSDPKTILRRASDEKKVFGDKMVVALRPADFKSLSQLNETIRQLHNAGIKKVALHDLKALRALIEKSN